MDVNHTGGTGTGLTLYKSGEIEEAIKYFRNAAQPLAAAEILTWAALTAHDGDFENACEILLAAPDESKAENKEERESILTCSLFEDVLTVANKKRKLDELKLKQKKRSFLIQYYLLFLPIKIFLNSLLAILRWSGRSSTSIIDELSTRLIDQFWISGLPTRPRFMSAERKLNSINYLNLSNDIYHRNFYAYLDYWINNSLDIQELLLASIKPADAHALYSIVRQKTPDVLIEIGTFVGFSTSIIATAIKDNGRGEIHCIDPDIKHLSVDHPVSHARKMLRVLDLTKHAKFHSGYFSPPKEKNNSIDVLGNNAANIFPPVDFAFIDGDHSTEAVIQDFTLLLPCLSEKSTVVFHDLKTWPSVRQGLHILLSGNLLDKYSVEFYTLTPSGLDGLGVIELMQK